jgi:hypothetical protein
MRLPPFNLRRRLDAAAAALFFRIQSRMAAQAGRRAAAVTWARLSAIVSRHDSILHEHAAKLLARQRARLAGG